MSASDHRLRVFICHSSQDKPTAREIYQRLNAEGWIDVWLDEEKLLPGQDWDMEIEKAVEAADAVIVCLSNQSVTKEGYVQRELRFVLDIALTKPDDTIFVIPVRLDDCIIPRRLRVWHFSDFFPEESQNRCYSRVLASLAARSTSINTHSVDSKKDLEKGSGVLVRSTGAEISDAKYANLVFLVHHVSDLRMYPDGVERYPIRLYVESFSDQVLDEIEKVVYHLHPTFEDPDREGTDRNMNFELRTGIWGEFQMSADVHFKEDMPPLTIFRYLNL